MSEKDEAAFGQNSQARWDQVGGGQADFDEVDFDVWRERARGLLARGVAPERVRWTSVGDLFEVVSTAPPTQALAIRVPKKFLDLGRLVICHRDASRFALLYRLLTRLAAEPRTLERATDADVLQLDAMARTVARDRHKMTAFVRFREIIEPEREKPRYVAWFEPSHFIEELTAPFFVDRYASMDFAILTPRRSILWSAGELGDAKEPGSEGQLAFGPGARREDVPDADGFSEAWNAYFRSTFNPARLKPRAMRREMPEKYWANMPETRQIAGMMAAALARVDDLLGAEPAQPIKRAPRRATIQIPPLGQEGSLQALRDEAKGCQRCDLWRPATQTVFGAGPADAKVLFVGEQPGDQEDLAGKPFIGPAGAVFAEALAAAGIDRQSVYVTNAVKHFKFEPRGKRRIHKTADSKEVVACRWWLEQELGAVSAPIVVALGATALFALTGERGKLTQWRGELRPFGEGRQLFPTVHPAFVLRVPDPEIQVRERQAFFADIAKIAAVLRESQC